MTGKEVTLHKLMRSPKGITVNDCPTGFRLSAVIKKLRETHDIIMVREEDLSSRYPRWIGRYILKGKK